MIPDVDSLNPNRRLEMEVSKLYVLSRLLDIADIVAEVSFPDYWNADDFDKMVDSFQTYHVWINSRPQAERDELASDALARLDGFTEELNGLWAQARLALPWIPELSREPPQATPEL